MLSVHLTNDLTHKFNPYDYIYICIYYVLYSVTQFRAITVLPGLNVPWIRVDNRRAIVFEKYRFISNPLLLVYSEKS
jgi:hypothetical protein